MGGVRLADVARTAEAARKAAESSAAISSAASQRLEHLMEMFSKTQACFSGRLGALEDQAAQAALPARLDVLRTLLRSDGASLYALNAPVRGVTPLGLAAWLNLPDVVRVLLEESRGLVAVDGTDSLGVTPLMCESSSGRLQIRIGCLTANQMLHAMVRWRLPRFWYALFFLRCRHGG